MSKFVSILRRSFRVIVENIMLPEENGGIKNGRYPSADLSRKS